MSDDLFTEVTSESWFGRIGRAFVGVLVGLALFVASFPLLFWNEGRAVKRYKTLKEGTAAVVSVGSDSVDEANEGKLIHLSGLATTDETLVDSIFGVSAQALKLRRSVEMYQWEEQTERRSRKKLGGGRRTVKTYRYSRTWNDKLVDSSSFREPEGHTNPRSMPFRSQEQLAKEAKLGAFSLSDGLLGKMQAYTPVQPKRVPAALSGKIKLSGHGFYAGSDPGSPGIGDCRIRFSVVEPAPVSVVARQVGSALAAYQTKVGGAIELLEMGTVPAEAMFQAARERNRIFTWILRAAGYVVMMIGLGLILRPLSVIADVIPFLGSLVGAGTGLMAFLIATPLSLITVAIAWIVFRPLIGSGLLAVALAFVIPIGGQMKSRRA